MQQHTEMQECICFADYLRAKKIKFHHVANESQGRSARDGAILKRMGLSRGFPDYLIFIPPHTIAIEMKRKIGGQVSVEQIIWIELLKRCGIKATVCNGAQDAISFVRQFI